jgi:hypothetical protein
MRRYIAIILIACCFSINAKAQEKVKPGFRAGANFSNFSDSSLDFRANFYVGGFIALKLSKYFTLQPEINYSQQGAKATFSNPDLTDHAPSKIAINYLSVGVLSKITFTDDVFVLAGPLLDYQTKSNVDVNSEIDLAATIGAGYTLPFGLTVEARAKLGIMDILDSDDYNNADNHVGGWNCNYLFQVGVAYSFDVKGATN